MSDQLLAGIKIAVIDDATTITRAADLYLQGPKDKPTGILVKTFTEGFDAIKDIFEFKPEIIFLDVMMQKVDGFTICRALKSNAQTRKTTIIMLTSKDGIFDRARGADAGADDYMVKPFTRDGILGVVRQHVALRRESA